MNIKFTSHIKNQGEDNKIEFVSPVTITEDFGYTVYEFVEPSHQIQNRIEVKEGEVNIFAGPSTINLVLNELIRNEYTTPQGSIYFGSFLTDLIIEENKIDMKYELKSNETLIGNFNIILSITNN